MSHEERARKRDDALAGTMPAELGASYYLEPPWEWRRITVQRIGWTDSQIIRVNTETGERRPA